MYYQCESNIGWRCNAMQIRRPFREPCGSKTVPQRVLSLRMFNFITALFREHFVEVRRRGAAERPVGRASPARFLTLSSWVLFMFVLIFTTQFHLKSCLNPTDPLLSHENLRWKSPMIIFPWKSGWNPTTPRCTVVLRPSGMPHVEQLNERQGIL